MDTRTTTLEDAVAVMSLFNGFDGLACDSLWWRTDGEYAPLTLIVNCNDLFYWGCADSERITAADVPDLQKACEDIAVAHATEDSTKHYGVLYGDLLWIARRRGQRPQLAYYNSFLNDAVKKLFDECGSEIEQYGTIAYADRCKEQRAQQQA